MIALTKEELALLHILSCDDTTRRTLKACRNKVELFPKRNLPHLNLILMQMLLELAECKKQRKPLKLNRQEFIANALKALEDSQMLDEQKDRGKALLTAYAEQVEELDKDKGKELLLYLIEQHCTRQVTSALGNSTAFASLRRMVDEGHALVQSMQEEAQEKQQGGVDLIATIPELMATKTRIPFGISYFDKATGGGACTGELAVIGAGTGGGKTMCATDIACNQAMLGNLTVWFTYEQPFNNDISERILANLTGIPLSTLRNKSFGELTPEQQHLYRSCTSGMDSLVGVDFSTTENFDPADEFDTGGVYSIEKQIKLAEQRTGRKCKFVILDWFGQIMENQAALQEVDLSKNYRHFARKFLADLLEMMKRLDVFVLLFHQLNAKCCDASPTYIPNKTDFQDIKSLANNAHWAFLIGKLDDNNVCWFRCDKGRLRGVGTQTIQLDGEHACFVAVEGWAPGRDGNFYNYKAVKDYGSDEDDGINTRANDILNAYT